MFGKHYLVLVAFMVIQRWENMLQISCFGPNLKAQHHIFCCPIYIPLKGDGKRELGLLRELVANPCNARKIFLFTIGKNTISILRTQMVKLKAVHS